MPSVRFLRRPPWKKLFLFTFLLTIVAATALYFCAYIPLKHAECHERRYFAELDHIKHTESTWQIMADYLEETDAEKPLPYNTRMTPLIHDAVQLRSWHWWEQLDLHEANLFGYSFAKYSVQQNWIYVGGTYRERSFWENFQVYSTPNGSCIDEPYICDSFNAGFNQLLEFYHTEGHLRTSRAGYPGFMDCDVSPLLCDDFNIDPVMLLHLETKSPCTSEFEPSFHLVCSTKWSLVSLPLKKMPFTKTRRIGEYIVPVFPTAFEQLHAMVSWDGSVDALELEEGVILENIVDNT
jgi:hypothetical protein